jgi:7-cyano-7-deazaguanine synthase in queuosine biosynthesis
MDQPDYIYEFDDITETCGTVRMNVPQTGEMHFAETAVAEQLLYLRSQMQMPPEIADLNDLVTAIQMGDRLSVRYEDRPYHIRICLPVRCPHNLGRPDLVAQLESILYRLTQDHWQFEFRQRCRPGRPTEAQSRWGLQRSVSELIEVILWSGGLDSTAGLVHRMSNEPDKHFVLVGTGSNRYIEGIQRQVVEHIEHKWPHRIQLIQLPMRNQVEPLRVNPRCRTRGFIFGILGAACAYLQGQRTLYVYENGTGALDLPLRKSEVGIDHSQAVHPLTLLEESHFVSDYLGTPFRLTNPSLYHTKAQMCEAFIQTDATDLIIHTITCDRRIRRPGLPIQCGRCSSCLLRRQALAAVGIDDPTPYAVMAALWRHQPADGDFLRAMAHQVRTLDRVLNTADPWQSLCAEHIDFVEIVDRIAGDDALAAAGMQKQFLNLYRRYADEWHMAEPCLRSGLIDNESIPIAPKISHPPMRGRQYGIEHSQHHGYARLRAETAGSPKK